MIDTLCRVDGICENTKYGNVMCNMHLQRSVLYGSATPTVECFGCKNEFRWVGPSFKSRKYCGECIQLWNTYERYIPTKISNGVKVPFKLHGLNWVRYLKLLISQGFRCPICGRHADDTKMAVDHNHSCCPGAQGCDNCIRGILCFRCNTFVGFVEKDPKITEGVLSWVKPRAKPA